MIGEGAANWFGGDVEAARRTVVPALLAAAGGAYGFAMPWLFGALSRAIARTMEAGGSQSGLALRAPSPGFASVMTTVGWVAMVAIIVLFGVFATGRVTGA